MKPILTCCVALLAGAPLLAATSALAEEHAAAIERTPAPADAEVYIISPTDGASVKSPLVVRFGLKGMGIAPAGIRFENTGHHHLLVDTEAPADEGAPLPNVEGKILHFGKGQTETTLTLAPGRHTLELVLGDALHVPFKPSIHSAKVTITVAP